METIIANQNNELSLPSEAKQLNLVPTNGQHGAGAFDYRQFMKAFLDQLFNHKIVCQHAELLQKMRLFRSLSYRELGLVELILHERHYQPEEVVFEEGEQGLGMYIVLEGQVKVIRRGILRKVLGKQEIAVLGPGESFGEMALLSNDSKRSATIIATAPTRLLSMFQPEFLRLLQTHDRIGSKLSYELARNMAERFQHAIEQNNYDEPS